MAYNKNETLIFKCYSYSDAAKTTLADADTVTFTLTDSAGTAIVTDVTATRIATGTYTYTRTLGTVLGLYTYKWTMRRNALVTIEYGHFVVEE